MSDPANDAWLEWSDANPDVHDGDTWPHRAFMAGYRRALEDAAVKVDSMRQINPMNGDGSNYTLDRALAIFDHLAESDDPSRAAEDAWDKRMDEYEAEYYNGDGKQRRERRARNRAAGVGTKDGDDDE